MQSRRPDDYRARPSSMASRLRDPRIQEDGPPDHYRREVVERSPPPRRSLSPHRRVGGGGEKRSGGSFEGRDFYRSDPRGESDHLRSQSTRFGRLDERRPENYPPRESRDELRRKYDATGEVVDYGNDLGLNRGSYGSFRGNVNDDPRHGVPECEVYHGDRRMVSQNGGGMLRGEYRLHPAAELESNVRDVKDIGGRYPLSSRNPDHASFNHEQDRYPDPNLLRKLVAIEKEERYSNADNFPHMERMERYGKHEELVPKSRDISYFKGSASASREHSGMPQSREYGAAPLRGSGMNIPSSYHGDVQHLPAETHPRRGSQHEERYLDNRSSEKRHMDRRDLAANHEDLLTYQGAEYKSRIHDGYQVGYMYPPHESQKNGNHSQVSEELSNNLHNPKQGGYYRGDNISADAVNPIRQHEAYADYSQRLHMHNSRSFRDQPTHSRSISDYLSDDRSLTAREQGGVYLDSRNAINEGGRYLDRRDVVNEFDETVLVEPEVGGMYLDPRDVVNEFNGKALVEPKVPLPDIPARDVFSRRKIVHVPERDDALLVPGRDSLRTPIDTQYEMELQEHHLRRKGIGSDDRYEYDISQRLPKRTKYPLDEEPSYYPTKRPLSSRLGNFNGEDQHDREDRWISGKARDYLPPKSMKSGHNINSRIGRHVGDSTSQDWDLSEDQDEYLPEYSSRSYQPGKRMLNGPPRHGLPKPYNHRHSLGSNVWVRDMDNKLHEESIDEQWESKEMMDSKESGPHEDLEDCEEFKQMVQEHFLSFSKILNEKISTRNRYKEQGRAGSLYCIVCGKSISKEFLDTRSLVTHCYMSKKVGLRESHLGLLKAICVLLGWNTVVDRDVVTFSPQVISNSEALAQKEDLIIWPPAIVIHGIPISASYTGRQNILTKEGVEEFLRGRGISVGKTKVVPGMSANNDIIVVKFLGTFSGLQDAKNLHSYFMDEKHGRLDYEQIAFGNNTKLERLPGPKLEESLIYGFMAISEDLDIVDFETKRKCTVKSKREIEDIADAPVTQI